MNIDNKHSDIHHENLGPANWANMPMLQENRMTYVPPRKPAEIKSLPKKTIEQTLENTNNDGRSQGSLHLKTEQSAIAK